jgi:hypothetical protein
MEIINVKIPRLQMLLWMEGKVTWSSKAKTNSLVALTAAVALSGKKLILLMDNGNYFLKFLSSTLLGECLRDFVCVLQHFT